MWENADLQGLAQVHLDFHFLIFTWIIYKFIWVAIQ